MRERELCQIFERVAAWAPDLVCLGGDLVDRQPGQILPLGKAVSLLNPPMGMFAVPGNHDLYTEPDLELWCATLQEHGVQVLHNEGRRLRRGDASLWLAGVDDLGQGEPNLPPAIEEAEEEEPILLLSHHPDLFSEASYCGVDLTLAGHTHGGQITLAGYSPLRHSLLGYWKGHYHDDGAQLYVGSGAGTTILPLRIGSPGEVPLITLRTALTREAR